MEENGITLDDILKVKEDGQCILFELFQKNFITVCLPLKFSTKLLTSTLPDVILSKEYSLFLKILNQTTNFLRGAVNE